MRTALRHALADLSARARRRGRVRAVAEADWADPATAGLRARLDRIEQSDGEAALAAAEPLLADLAWVRRCIGRLVAEASADPLFEPPLRSIAHDIQQGLQLFAHPALAITLSVLPVDRVAARKRASLGPRSIVFSGRRSLARVVRAGGGVLDLWAAEPAGDRFSAIDAPPCRPDGAMFLHDDALFAIDGARQSWTLAHATGDIVLLQAAAQARTAPLTMEYDAQTHAFLAASATDGAAMRIELLSGLLRRMGRSDAAPVLAAAIGTAPFHLRWALLRDLTVLDQAAAAPMLRHVATDDPHPEVRQAAAQTLARIAA